MKIKLKSEQNVGGLQEEEEVNNLKSAKEEVFFFLRKNSTIGLVLGADPRKTGKGSFTSLADYVVALP